MHWGFPEVRELCRHVGTDSGLVNTSTSAFLSLSDPYSLTHMQPLTHTHTHTAACPH